MAKKPPESQLSFSVVSCPLSQIPYLPSQPQDVPFWFLMYFALPHYHLISIDRVIQRQALLRKERQDYRLRSFCSTDTFSETRGSRSVSHHLTLGNY